MAMMLQDKRIFLIEDNLANRVIMQTLLEQHGARISFERWGKDTISRLRGFAPVDIILLDLMFPNGVTGYNIFDHIRTHPEFQYVPIVAVSASEPSIAIPRTREQGFDGFINKPIEYDRFPELVKTILNGKEVWDIG